MSLGQEGTPGCFVLPQLTSGGADGSCQASPATGVTALLGRPPGGGCWDGFKFTGFRSQEEA